MIHRRYQGGLALASIMSWQKEFRIISLDGKMCAYTKDGVVNTENISSERKYDEDEYRKIFGGSDSDQ